MVTDKWNLGPSRIDHTNGGYYHVLKGAKREWIGDLRCSTDEEKSKCQKIAAVPAMYAALEIVLAWASNQNTYDITTVVASVMEALREAGMSSKDLDSAAVCMMIGAAHIGPTRDDEEGD